MSLEQLQAYENQAAPAQEAKPRSTSRLLPLSRMQRQVIILGSLLGCDVLGLLLGFGGATLLRFHLLDYPLHLIDQAYYLRMLAVFVLVSLAFFLVFSLYSSRILFGGLEEYSAVFNAVTASTVGLVLFDFFTNRAESISRGWLLLLWVFALLLVGGLRFAFRRWVYFLRRRGHLLRPALLVNADAEGLALHEQLRQIASSGLRIQGFVDDRRPVGTEVCEGVKVLGGLGDLEALLANGKIEEVIVATGSLDREQLLGIFQAVSTAGEVKLRFSSGLFEMLSTGLYVKELASVPLIEVDRVRIVGMNAVLKAIFDYTLATVIMICFAPLFLALMLLVRVGSPGPIFYRHRVLGLHGKEFDAFKFRTMYVNGDEILAQHPELLEEFQVNWKLRDDPRVTPIGRFLRRTSLDELPQFINILRGEMSLIGPRFIAPRELEKFGKWGTNLLTVKPAITGLWQISGRSDTTYDERVRLDMYYIRNWTLWLDIYILFATPLAVFSRKGAY